MRLIATEILNLRTNSIDMTDQIHNDQHDDRRQPLSNADGFVALREATWEESCDECAYQEARHYCLLHSVSVKNMDTVRCDSFRCKYSQNK